MAEETKQTQRKPRGERRRRIFRSLHDCVISKGYTRTTLADVAEGAGMSASHLLYYFKGKDAILAEYFESIAVRFLERIGEFGSETAERQIELLADFWFRGEAGDRLEIGFMLECFGVAVHNEGLKVTKAGFDRQCKQYLRRIFQDAPALPLASPAEAAEIAYALMIGLRSAVYFDEDIDLEDAHHLFIDTLRGMCGNPRPGTAQP